MKGCLGLLKRITRISAILCLAALAVLAVSMDRLGQSNVTTAALIYVPPYLWLVPVFFLLLPALLFDWKTFPVLILAVILYFSFHLDYQWRAERIPGPPTPFETFRVLTWNRGQGKQASLSDYKNQLKPDFILLQDAAGRGAGYRKDANYREFREMAQAGEFVLLSRWPILSAQQLTLPPRPGEAGGITHLPAARFAVHAGGQRLILYSVHLPSPRDVLDSYKGGAFLWGILGIPGTPWESKKRHYQVYWDGQIAMANNILLRIQEEKEPTLVMGDFNTPALGPIYRMFADTLQDAHRVSGSGLGFTFPGDTRNPIALFQPWLRLDQIFSSSHWETLNCAPQTAKAQHLPVFGEFKLVKPES